MMGKKKNQTHISGPCGAVDPGVPPFETFFKVAPDMQCLIGADGCFIRTNPAWNQTFGVGEAELRDHPVTDFIHPEDASSATDAISALISFERAAVQFDARFSVGGDDWRDLAWNAAVDEPSGMIFACVRDLSEPRSLERRALENERKAREAEGLLRDAIESISEGFVIYNANGSLVICNEVFREFYGYSEIEAAPGAHFRELGRLDIERGTVVVNSAEPESYIGRRDGFREGKLYPLTIQLADGRFLQTRDRKTAMGGVVSVQTDVTNLVKSEQELRNAQNNLERIVADRTRELEKEITVRLNTKKSLVRSREELDAILRTSPAVIYKVFLQASPRLSFVSPNTERITGFTPEECVSVKDWWQNQVHPEDREKVSKGLEALLNEGTQTLTYRFRHKNGTYIWLRDEITVRYDRAGKPLEMVGSSLDITKEMTEKRRSAVADALDKLTMGIVCLNKEGRVLSSNRRAKAIIAEQDGIGVNADGYCVASTPPENRTLKRIISNILDRDRDSEGHAMAISRPSGRRSYSILVTRTADVPYDLDPEDHAAILFISDPEWKVETSANIIAAMYGLADHEARVATALAVGDSIREAASRLGITEGTARMYLKSVFSKTGTNRQAELVRLILSGPASLWWREAHEHGTTE